MADTQKQNKFIWLWLLLLSLLVGWLTYLANTGSVNTAPPFFSFMAGDPTLDYVLQGALAGFICFIGTIVIALLPRGRWLAAIILLVIVTPIALAGFWFSTGQLGISDWDYYFSYHHEIRDSFLEHQAFPFWNPYICGGTAGLADPEFPLFTPTFLLEFIFGIPVGFKLAIFLVTIITGTGMLVLARKIGLSVYAALLSAIAVSFGSVNLLEIVEGHPNVFSAMWVPWIFWAWLRAYRQPRFINIILPGIFLALTFYAGGIYMLMYVTLALLLSIALSHKRVVALKITIISGLLGMALSAVKLIPVLMWLSNFQDEAYASSAATIFSLPKIFLGRFLHGSENVIPQQGSGWHEYGAYVGPIILFLAFIAILNWHKIRWVRILLIGALAALLISSTGPVLKPFFDQLPFLPRSNISRIVLFTVIPLALLAGFGLDFLRQKMRARAAPVLAVIVIGLAAVDLMSLSYPLSQQAFVLPYPIIDVHPLPEDVPIAYTIDKNTYRYGEVDYTRAYAESVNGYGTQTYCSVLGPQPTVRTLQHEEDQSYLSISDPAGKISLIDWSPNRIVIEAMAVAPAEIVLNANFAPGWNVNSGSVKSAGGRLATDILPGEYTLEFQYSTPGFRFGLSVTVLSLLLIAGWVAHVVWKKSLY